MTPEERQTRLNDVARKKSHYNTLFTSESGQVFIDDMVARIDEYRGMAKNAVGEPKLRLLYHDRADEIASLLEDIGRHITPLSRE